MKVTTTFIYNGLKEQEYTGTIINEIVKRAMVKAEKKNGEWWSHYYPKHSVKSKSKKGLWEEVKAAALQTRNTAIVRVISGNTTQIINLTR